MSRVVPDISARVLVEEYSKLKGKLDERQTILSELQTVKSTVAKHPQGRFYFVDSKCLLRCKSGTIDGILQEEIAMITKDINKLGEGLRNAEDELKKLEGRATSEH